MFFAPMQPAFASGMVESNVPIYITGQFGVGGKLSLVHPEAVQGGSLEYVWLADGEVVQSGNSPTLDLTAAHLNQVISARVTVHEPGLADLVVTASGYKVFSSVPFSSSRAGYFDETISEPDCFNPRSFEASPARIGFPLNMYCSVYNTNFKSPKETRWQWYRNSKPIDQANRSTYRLTAEDGGQTVWGAYTAVWENGFVFTQMKKLREPIAKQLQLAKPKIVGSLELGASLIANTNGSDKEATLSYQWFSDYIPVTGATSSVYKVQAGDVGKAVQVMIKGQRDGYAPASRLSDPVDAAKVSALDPRRAYNAIASRIKPTKTEYQIRYIVSPNVTDASLAREKALVQVAADFWIDELVPKGVTIIYMTKDDADWGNRLLDQNPSWKNGVPGGFTPWVKDKECGFALAFKADGKQVYVQCIRNGADSGLNDQQVGPHEYSHWFQYEQNTQLPFFNVPWLIEGQAKFYGLALGIAPEDPDLHYVNISIAGEATQFDLYNGFEFGSLRSMAVMEVGDSIDNQVMLTRTGTTWDQYAIGSIVSEWLVMKFGHDKYVAYTKELIRRSTQDRDSQTALNLEVFKKHFGFGFEQLGEYMAPYLMARGPQLRVAWALNMANQVKGETLGSIQQLPAFAGTSTVMNSNQKDWLDRRLIVAKPSTLVCTAKYSSKVTAKQQKTLRVKATTACAYGASKLNKIGVLSITRVVMARTSKVSESGQIYIGFRK